MKPVTIPIRAFGGALALLITLAVSGLWGQSQALVIEGGTLVDGGGGAPVRNSVVVIEGTRIVAVGARGDVSYPPQATIINADGMTVLPGFIDAHIHSLDYFPPLFLHFGITTVLDTANPTAWVIALRDALNTGTIKGPRMFVTGEAIDGPGDVDERLSARSAYRTRTNTPEEARTLARSLLRRGVDALKAYQNLSLDGLQAIVEEARKAGTEVVGHVRDARDATLAGFTFIEHATPIAHATLGDPALVKAMDEGKLRTPEADMDPTLFGPLIELMVEHGVYLNPTLTRSWISAHPKRAEWYRAAAALLEDPAYRFIPAARRQRWLRTATGEPESVEPRMLEGLRKVEEFTRRYAQAGGRVINGPDSGPSSGPANMAGLALHVEMEALVDAGLTPMQAILSATRWPAELLHREKELGTVAPGKIADLVLVDGDPLADIRATRNIRTVIMNGAVVDTTLDPSFRSPLPRPIDEYTMNWRDENLHASAIARTLPLGGGAYPWWSERWSR